MTRQTLPTGIDDRFELGALLGAGASGAVYEATDRRSGSGLALKVMHQPLTTDRERARFEREVAAHERLAGVRGVVRVHDHGVADGRGWIAMDRHDVTLAERLASTGPMAPAEVVGVLSECADALDAMHGAGILHRDIKPSNVFLDRDGHAVLADFGVVEFTADATLTGMTPLSLQWAAPETIETGEASIATDIYSLGTTAFTLLQGGPPFDLTLREGDTEGATIAIGPALRLIAAGDRPVLGEAIPPELRSLVDEMIAVDPAMRPQSAGEVRNRLAAMRTAPVRVETPIEARGSRRPWLLVALAVVVAVGVAIAWFSQRDGETAESAQVERVESVESVEPEPVAAGICGDGVLWCEPLTLADWSMTGDPEITTFTEVETEFGQGLLLTPGPATDGGYSADRSLVGVGSPPELVVRARLRIDDLTDAARDEGWFQSIVSISDERGSQWNINLISDSAGLVFNTGFAVADDVSGGSSALGNHPTSVWHCLELVLRETGATPVELRVDGATIIQLQDAPAAERGEGLLVSLGPRWLQGADRAPQVTIADVVVGTEPGSC